MANKFTQQSNNKKIFIILFTLALLICLIFWGGLHRTQSISEKINNLREGNQRNLDSFTNSIAAQKQSEAYVRHLISTKENLLFAEQVVDSVLNKYPNDGYFRVLKGQIYDAKMRYDSALLEFNLAIKRDSFPYALDMRAKTFIKLRKYDQAIADYRIAFGRNFDYSFHLSSLFSILHQKDSALKYYLIYKKYYPDFDTGKTRQFLEK